MPKVPQFSGLLADLLADLHDKQALWQAAAVAVCLVIAAIITAVVRTRLAGTEDKRLLGWETLAAVMFPLSGLLCAFVARAVLAQANHNLLNLLIELLTAGIIIRLAVVMLRQVFAPSGWRDTLMRTVAITVWMGFALHISGLSGEVVAFLDGFGFEAGKSRFSLWLILRGVTSLLVAVLVAMWLGRLIEARAMAATGLDVNMRVMFAKLAQALLVVLAVLLALPAVGIDLTMLSVFGGALGVGVGFGLQKIASNYLSGFIILMDRSVSIGDVVTIDNQTGHLTKMTMRHVVVRSLAGVEAIIPNDTLITSTVINHSYTDRRVRKAVAVQIGYECDLDRALELLVQIGKADKRVLAEPTPKGLVKGFGASGIDLELGYWVDEPLTGSGLHRSDLLRAIWRTFKAEGISIPYPQREVRMIVSKDAAPPPVQGAAPPPPQT